MSSLDIRPANDEDVSNIVFLILPYLPQAECTGEQSQFASINVETRIRGIDWCWQMYGSYMTFRPHGFPRGHIEFRAEIVETAEEIGRPCPGLSYVVSPQMIYAYQWIRENRGHTGKNRVAAFFPPEQTQELSKEFERIPYEPPYQPPKPIQVDSFWSLLRYVGNKMFGDR